MIQRLAYGQPDLEEQLDKLGKDGWELSGTANVQMNFSVTRQVAVLFFKREIPEQPAELRQATTGEILEHLHGSNRIVDNSVDIDDLH